ncbi:hypothetical protein AB0442_28985 [Kitasatospora sp. NPDC085895]|uniref:hypothetical protein n=1 Tax=Kitasatospora sp. NPDC085895 TaxID=3155057 RepID=UPI00344C22B5
MYVVVQHTILDPETAFSRGRALMSGSGAPDGTRVLQFYPHVGGSAVACLWEAESVGDVQRFVDTTLGDSSTNLCYEVDADRAFADRPLGLRPSPAPVTHPGPSGTS